MDHRLLALLLLGCALSACAEFPVRPLDAGVGDARDAAPELIDEPIEDAVDLPEAPDVPVAECDGDDLTRCPPVTGALPTDCVDDKCLYICRAGSADRDGDLTLGAAGTGCECASEEVCNGIDDDCDGQVDEGLGGGLCPLQNGVCAGAMASCEEPVCGPATYDRAHGERSFIDGLDGWCDGLDNDCNGATDELCCTDGFLHPTSQARLLRQVRPSVASSSTGLVAVAWEETQSTLVRDRAPPDTIVGLMVYSANLTPFAGPHYLAPSSGYAHWPHLDWDGSAFVLTYATTSGQTVTIHRATSPTDGAAVEEVVAVGEADLIFDLATAAGGGAQAVGWVSADRGVCTTGASCVVASVRGPDWTYEGRIGGDSADSVALAFGAQGRLMVAWHERERREIRGTVVDGGGPGPLFVVQLDGNLESPVRPALTAFGTEFVLGHVDAGEDDVYLVRRVGRDGTVGPATTVYTENAGGNLWNIELATGDGLVGILFTDRGPDTLDYVAYDPTDGSLPFRRSLESRVGISHHGLALVQHPRTGLAGVIARHGLGEGSQPGHIETLFINQDGDTLCLPR